MNWLKLSMVMLFWTITATTYAAPVQPVNVGLKDVIDTVEVPFKPDQSGVPILADVTAYFFQRSTIAEKQKEIRADGQMYLRTATSSTPMMFRFEYFRPTRHEIVTDGRTLWTYLPENRQVIQSDISFFNRPGFNPDRDQAFNFLQGLARISKDFQINFSPQRQDVEGNYILELNPRRSMASIRQLFVVVNRDAVLRNAFMKQGRNFAPNQPALLFPIISTTVLDHQGNSTIMEFTNIVTNSRLSNFLFNFVVPAGVQVVRPPVGP